MSLQPNISVADEPAPPHSAEADEHSLRRYWRNAVLFLGVAALIYLAVYAAADQLVYRYAKRNRFFNVKTAPLDQYDVVILGASHAAVFDYQDMTAQLEQRTGLKIMNLSEVGSGVMINRLLLDYFWLTTALARWCICRFICLLQARTGTKSAWRTCDCSIARL